MKIIIFIKSSSASGGLETQNQLLVKGLRERGHEVEVVETASPFGDGGGPKARGYTSADVVISQSAAGTSFLLSRRGRKPPVVVIQHGTLGGSLKTRLRMDGFSWRLIPYALKAYILDQLRLRRCEAIVAVSEKVKRDLIREYFLPEKKIKVVYNGVEIMKLGDGKLRNYETGGGEIKKLRNYEIKKLLYLGRLAKEKGLTTLLAAISNFPISQFPNFRLLIIGSGPDFSHLNKRTQELGLSDVVEFVGKVPYEETPKYYQQADVFVLPSIADEGLPMAVIEAMAAGLPVVASKVGGIPEAVVNGETGLLVEPENVKELSAALKKLLTAEKLRSRMGKTARQVAEEKFSQKAMVAETIEICGRIVPLTNRV